MKINYTDLHIHSNHSDGSYSPEEILDIAIEKKMSIISITDHNTLDGSRELMNLCQHKNITCIPGVELDAIHAGINYHILGYGVDLNNDTFESFTNHNNNLLEEVNISLIRKMEPEYNCISLNDYSNFTFQKKDGGWKTLYYFLSLGLTSNLTDGFKYYAKYNHSYTCVGFPDITTVCEQIHKAGGVAVIAHPGRVIKNVTITEFEQELRSLLSFPIDGIECYYPSHSEEITNSCLVICKENNLLITGGSDCHGTFEDTRIGHMKITQKNLSLRDLI